MYARHGWLAGRSGGRAVLSEASRPQGLALYNALWCCSESMGKSWKVFFYDLAVLKHFLVDDFW